MRISDWSSDVRSSDLSDVGVVTALPTRMGSIALPRLEMPGILANARGCRAPRHDATLRVASRRRPCSSCTPLSSLWPAGPRLPPLFPCPCCHSTPPPCPGPTPPPRRRSTRAWPPPTRSEEHTSELPSLMRISYAVFCLQQKTHSTH